MPNITHVRECFEYALEQTMRTYSSQMETEILAFIIATCSKTQSWNMMTPAGLIRINDIFTSEIQRDFILTLYFNFVGRLEDPSPDANAFSLLGELAKQLALALCPNTSVKASTTSNNSSVMSEEVRTRLSTYGDTLDILLNNPWIMVLVLMVMFINIQDFQQSLEKAVGKQQRLPNQSG